MKGLILINTYFRTDEVMYQPGRLAEEFAALGVTADVRSGDFFPFTLMENGEIDNRVKEYDFCIFLDKDKYLGDLLEKTGIPVFNSSYSVSVCDDKMLTLLALCGADIPVPRTLPGLLCFSEGMQIEDRALDRIEEELGYPVVVKESYGSLGKGVYLARNREELRHAANRVIGKPHLFQQFIGSSYGKDMRVIVIGGRVIGGMLRRSDKDFRSNIGAGGIGEPCEVDGKTADLAIRAAQALKLDYCGMDFLFGENSPVLCEVNSNAFFGGFEKVTGINVAREYALYVIEETKKRSCNKKH